MEATKGLIDKIMAITFKNLPQTTVNLSKYFFLDYIGVAARGALSNSSKPVHNFLHKLNAAKGGAVVIGTSIKAQPAYAALANGTASHSLELDDVVNEASLHPGVAIISAALDAAHLSDASGSQMIESIVIGYEVMVRLGICLGPSAHYSQGFHPTGTCGAFGCAATAGRLLGLNEKQMVNAFGIAGSQTAGSMEFLNNGAYTKRLHPGWAAHAGIVAAILAKEGFTGPDTILEGDAGFLKAYSPSSDVSKLLDAWERPYKIEKTSIKPHACCRYKQGPLDCIQEIIQNQNLTPQEIETVTISVLKTGMPFVAEPKQLKYNPRSIVDAQFSMPFGAAVVILYGKASLDEYIEENLKKPAIKDMMCRIVCITDDDIEKEFPKKWPAKVTIKSKDGQTFFAEVEYPKGDPENPLNWCDVIAKFNDLTSSVFTENQREIIIDKVKKLEQEESIKKFCNILST